jgi:ATP-binding cassette subfamily G (WHITE) protein 2
VRISPELSAFEEDESSLKLQNTQKGINMSAVKESKLVEKGEVELVEVDPEAGLSERQNPLERRMTFSPLSNPDAPTVLTFTNVTVVAKGNKRARRILDGLSGTITGGFWAIMGASGSGKTTFLSTVSLRLDANYMDITGEFRLNGREYSRADLKAVSAYVMQDDLLHAELTVYETLWYAAMLRMGNTTNELRGKRIGEVLALMRIEHCRDVIIGNSRRKGISGGERKRVSIAVELLSRPKLIFLDEPTSGLDSTTALTVCEALKELADRGECTVMCTIHQPQPTIFELFDNLILMKLGTIVYQGPASKTEAFLEQMGFPCPPDSAIADHLLDVINPYNEEGSTVDDRVKEKLQVPVNLSLGIEKSLDTKQAVRSWFAQFCILFHRNWYQYIRNYDTIIITLIVAVLLAVFTGGGIWRSIGHDSTSIPLRVPALFFICVTQGIVGSLQSVNSFPGERAIMLRERQAGAYQTSSYFAAKSAVDLLVQAWPTFIFCCIVYPMIGFRQRAGHFFLFCYFVIMNAFSAVSLASVGKGKLQTFYFHFRSDLIFFSSFSFFFFLVTTMCVSIELSTVVLSFFLEWCRLWGGFFASPAQMKIDAPNWKFAQLLSFMNWSFLGIVQNELTDLDLSCYPGKSPCKQNNGNVIIAANDYDEFTIGECAGILIVYVVGCRLIAYLALRFIKV